MWIVSAIRYELVVSPQRQTLVRVSEGVIQHSSMSGFRKLSSTKNDLCL